MLSSSIICSLFIGAPTVRHTTLGIRILECSINFPSHSIHHLTLLLKQRSSSSSSSTLFELARIMCPPEGQTVHALPMHLPQDFCLSYRYSPVESSLGAPCGPRCSMLVGRGIGKWRFERALFTGNLTFAVTTQVFLASLKQ